MSQIISRLNEIFITDHLTDGDLVSYANTLCDKVSENSVVMNQIANNSPEQAMLGEFAKAMDDAIMDGGEAHQNQMIQLLSDSGKLNDFNAVVFKMLLQKLAETTVGNR